MNDGVVVTVHKNLHLLVIVLLSVIAVEVHFCDAKIRIGLFVSLLVQTILGTTIVGVVVRDVKISLDFFELALTSYH